MPASGFHCMLRLKGKSEVVNLAILTVKCSFRLKQIRFKYIRYFCIRWRSLNSQNLLLNILELKNAIKYLGKKHATERSKYNKYGEKNFSQIKQSKQLHLLQFISSNLSNTRGMMNTFFYCQVNGYVHVTPHIHSYRHTHGHVAIVLWPRVSRYTIVLCTLHILYTWAATSSRGFHNTKFSSRIL